MSDYESDDEGQPIERRPRRRHADRGNVPISNHHQQRTHPIRPQVHHQMQAQMQPAQPQRPTPPQDRYRAAHVNQHPTNDLRAVASTQQYHEDTYRRPSSHSEAQSSRESRYERSTNSTPYHDRSSYMRSSANQCSTRADSGSDGEVNAPSPTPNNRQTRDALRGIYGRDYRDPELQVPQIYRDSANPVQDATATPGGYPYPQTLDIPTGQHNQVYSSSYTSTRCPYGCPAHPGYHCHHAREQR